MNRFPPEVLAEIFSSCISFPPTSGSPVFTTRHVNVILCNVCGNWRDVAILTPCLWSFIWVTFNQDEPPKMTPKRIEAVDLWLQRSKTHPLYFGVINPGSPQVGDDAEPQHDLVVAALVQHAARWKTARIHTPEYPISPALANINISTIGISLLQNFYADTRSEIIVLDPGGNNNPIAAVAGALSSLISSSISLRKLDYRGSIPLRTWRPVAWPKSLTKVRLHTALISVRDLWELISSCPLLNHLWVFPLIHSRESYIPPRQIVHSNLHSLHLNTLTVVDPLFENLTLPSLGQLSVTAIAVATQVCGMTVLRNLISRSTCSLDLLSLSLFDVGTEEFFSLLSTTPSLKRLGLQEVQGGISPVGDQLLLRLTANTPGYLCPELFRFKWEIEGGDSTDGLLGAMAASRRLTQSNPDVYDGLDVIEIQAPSGWCQRHPEDLRRLKEVSIAKGLKVMGSVFNTELAQIFTQD